MFCMPYFKICLFEKYNTVDLESSRLAIVKEKSLENGIFSGQ